jgi:aspartate/tyrosine/aromatic aminotransferase
MFFHEVPEGPPDAVFGLTGAFRADPRPQKINLLVGIYKNAELKSELMPSVRQAKEHCLPDAHMADYLPMDGFQELIDALGPILFGESVWPSNRHRIYGTQAIGGTGALRVGAEFLAQEVTKTIYIPQPSWPNHRAIFERAGCHVETYPYYDRSKHRFDFQTFLAFLKKLPPKTAVLLHAACHNPTGCDPTIAEWEEIAKAMREHQLLPFFDFAYQGLGDGLEQDAQAVRHFVKEGLECIVAYSCSKNFSLYCQRVGALYIVSEKEIEKTRVASQVKRIIRALYSNPPAAGAFIVAHILQGPLRSQWEKELTAMRRRLESVRTAFVQGLMAKEQRNDFSPMLQHKGMFSFVDLEKADVQQLIDRYAIYMLDNGRISVAGLNEKNIDYVIDSLVAVMRDRRSSQEF